METTKKQVGENTIQTNWMLDDVIDSFNARGVDNDDLIKELTIQKIEYGRTCMFCILKESNEQEVSKFAKELDAGLQKRIIELGGTPKEILIVNKTGIPNF